MVRTGMTYLTFGNDVVREERRLIRSSGALRGYRV
jgi:hypothetical protein